MDRDWELKAACRTEDPEVFFSDRTRSQAKAICAGCPVWAECLEAVLVREAHVPKTYRTGIVAGRTGVQRWQLEQQKPDREALKKAAPPKPKSKPKPKSGLRSAANRPLAECGTRAAYQRHLRNNEPIDAECRDANSASRRAWTATGSTRLRSAG
ncbi:WhiB family transcriptional regulator [Streptomyces brasiliscabiei]|uniref:WhiB family transcriptional regulator n=1 Tax=Streptomyces brasiliscabiei TaxID=2736302 RepID=UPI0038F5DEA4